MTQPLLWERPELAPFVEICRGATHLDLRDIFGCGDRDYATLNNLKRGLHRLQRCAVRPVGLDGPTTPIVGPPIPRLVLGDGRGV